MQCTYAYHVNLIYLADLPRVALVRVLCIILQGLGAREFVITRWRRTDVALTGDLSSKPRHRTRYWGNW